MRGTLLITLVLAIAPAVRSSIQADQQSQAPVRQEQQEAFQVMGMTVRTTNAREAGPDGEIPKLWRRAMQEAIFDKIPNRADKNIVVVNSGYASDVNGEYDYTLGARVTRIDSIPTGFVSKSIAPGRYAVILSQQGPPSQVVPGVWKQIWKMTPEELGGSRAFRTDFEVYPPSADPQKCRLQCILESAEVLRFEHPRRPNAHSAAAIASQIFSIAEISAVSPGRWPLTRIENASVLPLAVVR
jgi:predicted transcriptional regulator YdeE